jgi:heme/copper-type cytochrome/quinol oxidase subunit 2
MFKNKTQAVVIVSVLMLFLSVFSVHAGAQQISEIPGQGGTTNSFFTYLEALYNFAISISGVLAIFMIAFGAFIYIVTSAGNSSKMADAKDMIYNAIIGLIIVLVAWLILFVVNPDLVGHTVTPTSTIDDYIH